MARGILHRLLTLGFTGVSALTLLHCAEGVQFDPSEAQAGGAGKGGSKTGSGGGLAAGGSAGAPVTTGGSGSTGSPDASSTGGSAGSGGSGGGQAESGAAGSGMADVVTYDVAPCPTCALNVQYSNQRLNETTNEVGFNLIVKNPTSNIVKVNLIALRYWYTIDGEANQESAVDHVSQGGATLTFVKVMPARTGADYYMEMKLTGTGELNIGQTVELHVRFHKAGYQGDYKQGDDYSFGAGHMAFGDWPKITAYVGGDAKPVWGTEP